MRYDDLGTVGSGARFYRVVVAEGETQGLGNLRVGADSFVAGTGVGLQSSNGENPYVAVLDGEFTSDPAAGTLRFEGNASYRDVTLTGAGQVTLAEAVFDLAGSFRIGGPGGAPYGLANGVFRLKRPADAEPVFEIEGEPTLAMFDALLCG